MDLAHVLDEDGISHLRDMVNTRLLCVGLLRTTVFPAPWPEDGVTSKCACCDYQLEVRRAAPAVKPVGQLSGRDGI